MIQMKQKLLFIILILWSLSGMAQQIEQHGFSEVEVEDLLRDSISIRAIKISGDKLIFAGSEGRFGIYNTEEDEVEVRVQRFDSTAPEFRSVAATPERYFMLSIGNPALLYSWKGQGEPELVYKEEHQNVFYDSMIFWNAREGIAMGDPVENCLSIIITRDGGDSWQKLDCRKLPKTAEGEAAFAASNSNIAVVGDKTWLISGGIKSRIFYSPDKGRSWKVFELPVVEGENTTGAYSVDFYDEKHGAVIGGDYLNPGNDSANKAVTTDGGRTWKLVAVNKAPGYRSSIRYVPGSKAEKLVVTGKFGISFSGDAGKTWRKISDESFYTIRFLNDSVAYAAGKNRLSRLHFK